MKVRSFCPNKTIVILLTFLTVFADGRDLLSSRIRRSPLKQNAFLCSFERINKLIIPQIWQNCGEVSRRTIISL
nr:unnamed protein product [Callosobruchus chinensis]